ncbi:MAG: NADH:ubiquinone reductase (Na(+)-transporting) subunit C [Bacteroidetes bacterium]|nr:NADH:ubiquinone reductase (Na(+)-transporting) subunit C [Bacteroidota bacterium]HET6245964.1 NADH:ubiquinone reductase (Na(+)-transporting) subunit C [Bacteroidia bacterium]
MNKNSNIYTFGFSAALVIVVGLLLASAAIGLKPFQSANVRIEKMQDIIGSVGISATPAQAEEKFNSIIKEQLVLTSEGKVVDGAEYTAFDIDLSKEIKKPHEKRQYPLFIANLDDKKFFIVPMRGKGLWGPIWGYIALDASMNVFNVYGAKFDHKSETPGLGAEINTTEFQKQFVDKLIFDEGGNYKPIKAIKGGVAAGDMHAVDAISGGTITSNGVNEMIKRTLEIYVPFFKEYTTTGLETIPAEQVEDAETISPDAAGGVSAEEGAESETEELKKDSK